MSPTNEQIIAEANSRRKERGMDGLLLADFIIEVMREGWTPPDPEPVDPDVLAFREWAANDHEADAWTGGALLCRLGRHDDTEEARAFLAGARMAREQERERAGKTIAMAKELAATYRLFLQRLPLDFRAQLGVKCEVDEGFTKDVEAEIAKYMGEAR